MGNEAFFACENLKNSTNHTDCNRIIGYSYNSIIPSLFLVVSFAGLVLNLWLVIDYYRRKTINNSRKQSSMKKLFVVLPILDSITCVYWILSSIFFWKAEKIKENMQFCIFLSIVYISVFTFEFIFINFILIHFRKISLNPIEGILKPEKNIIIYFIISIVFTAIMLTLSLTMKIIGRSPMITCFINTEDSEKNGFIFWIPTVTIISVIVQIIYDLCCREMFVTDKEVRQAYKTNITYVLVYTLLHIPLLILITITAGKKYIIKDEDKALIGFSFFCTFLTCSIPMIIGIVRNCKGFTKIKQIKQLERRLTRSTRKSIVGFNADYNRPFNDNSNEDQFDWLEKHAMEFFMRDILLGIAHCVNNSKTFTENGEKIKLNLQNKENEEILKHNITINNFPLKDRDQEVRNSRYLNINIIEYAPRIFAFLRNIENIDLDEMIDSFLPKNNKKGISKSQGKSGSFFISTDDNQYMVKTLRVDEFELIRHTFLNHYVQYITHNPDSLLCRIYGMYNIIMSQGEEILIIVMRNVIGDFQDNIVAKYDLKGSTANRKADFNMETSDSSTMKDLNFNEYEHGIMISRENIKKFREMTKSDSLFLCRLELMDYSVFLVKLTLSKKEETDIFGEGIRKRQKNEFSELMVSQSIKPSFMEGELNLNNNSDEQNLKINEIKEIDRQFSGEGKIYNIKHYKQYLYPSLNPGTAYILAIIDYFQMFNFYKYVESGIKTKFSKNAEGVSCVEPKTYSKRFINYFIKLTEIKHLYKDNNRMDKSNLNYDENENEKDNTETTFEGSNIEMRTFN